MRSVASEEFEWEVVQGMLTEVCARKRHRENVQKNPEYYRQAMRKHRQKRQAELEKLKESIYMLETEQIAFRNQIKHLQHSMSSLRQQFNPLSEGFLKEENRILRSELKTQRELSSGIKLWLTSISMEKQRLSYSLFVATDRSHSLTEFIDLLDSSMSNKIWRLVDVAPYRVMDDRFEDSKLHCQFMYLPLKGETIYRIDIEDLPFDYEENLSLKKYFEDLDYCRAFMRSVKRFIPKIKSRRRSGHSLFRNDDSLLVRWKHSKEKDGVLQHVSHAKKSFPSSLFPNAKGDDNVNCAVHVVSKFKYSEFELENSLRDLDESYAYFIRRNDKFKTDITIIKRINGLPQNDEREMTTMRELGYSNYSEKAFASSAVFASCHLTTQIINFGLQNQSSSA